MDIEPRGTPIAPLPLLVFDTNILMDVLLRRDNASAAFLVE